MLAASLWMACGQNEPVAKPVPAPRLLKAALEATAVTSAASPSATNKEAASSQTKAPPDLLEFLSGDTLRGKYLGWDSTGIRWQHEGVAGELRVIPDKIRKFRLSRIPQKAPKTSQARLVLHNGDRFSVNLLEMDAEKGVFQSWYAGNLTIPRSAISNLTLFMASGDLLYHGPTGLEGWHQSSPLRAGLLIRNQLVLADGDGVAAREERREEEQAPAWTFTGDALEALRPGAIGRNLKLPRQSSVSLELEAPNTPAFSLHLYADAVDKFTGMNALSFTFSGRMVYLRRSLANGGSRQISSVEHTKFAAGGPARVKLTICTDLDQQILAFYIDDLLLRKFSIGGQVEGLGTGLIIQQQSAASLKVTHLAVNRWNGVTEEVAATPSVLKEDLILLNNRDKISGQLLTVHKGQAAFQTAFSKIEIPLERIQLIAFAPPSAAPRETQRQARVLLGDAGRLTLQIRQWDEEVIEGTSPLLGPLKLNARAVVGVQFE